MVHISGLIAATVFSYFLAAVLLFGGPLAPIAFLLFWNDRLGAPYWPGLDFIGLALGIISAWSTAYLTNSFVFAAPAFVIVSMVSSVLFVGIYAETKRSSVIDAFGAEQEIRNSFFRSLHEAPRDFQFFLHGMALKDCVPYGWSYGTMSFYRLPPNAAVNVVPSDWINICQIERE